MRRAIEARGLKGKTRHARLNGTAARAVNPHTRLRAFVLVEARPRISNIQLTRTQWSDASFNGGKKGDNGVGKSEIQT